MKHHGNGKKRDKLMAEGRIPCVAMNEKPQSHLNEEETHLDKHTKKINYV